MDSEMARFKKMLADYRKTPEGQKAAKKKEAHQKKMMGKQTPVFSGGKVTGRLHAKKSK